MQVVIPVDVDDKPKRRPPPRFASMAKASERESTNSQASVITVNASLGNPEPRVF